MWLISRFGGYAALGYGGQYIFVVPELEMVMVFTGGLYQGNDIFYPGELMENYIVPSVKSDNPLGHNLAVQEQLQKAIDKVQNAPLPTCGVTKKLFNFEFANPQKTVFILP